MERRGRARRDAHLAVNAWDMVIGGLDHWRLSRRFSERAQAHFSWLLWRKLLVPVMLGNVGVAGPWAGLPVILSIVLADSPRETQRRQEPGLPGGNVARGALPAACTLPFAPFAFLGVFALKCGAYAACLCRSAEAISAGNVASRSRQAQPARPANPLIE